MASLSEFGPRVISVLLTLGTNWMCTQHFSNHSVREWGNRIRSSHGDKQLTRSLVTAWEACAGSTTAASKASSRPGEEHHWKQPHTLPILHQRKNTSVFAPHTKHRTSSCTSSLKHIQQNHGGQLKLKIKLRRRRTSSYLRRRRTSRS
jgi:hypothetical protein